MQWITFIAGFVAGYKSGTAFDRFALASIACFAAAIEGVFLLFLATQIEWGWDIVPSIALAWLELFAWGAVPCIFMGWLMSRQNSGNE